MKKVIIFLILVLGMSAMSIGQTASFSMKTVAAKTYATDYTLTNAVADTFIFYAPRLYPATQAYSVHMDSVSGNHTNIAVSLYGSLLGDTYTQIGSTANWVTGASPTYDTTLSIVNSTANRYNYYKVIFVGTGTGVATIDWQTLQIWTSGELSDGTATLSAGSLTGIVNITGTGDLTMTGGDIIGKNGNAIDIGEGTDGTIVFSRDDAGTVTLTSADNDANAALTVSAGGTGALTLGDAGSTTSITSSDWAIGATGIATGLGAITADGLITGTAGATVTGAAVNLNASSNFAVNVGTGTTTAAVSIGGGSNTVAVNSSAWDISSAGVATGLLRTVVVNTDESETLTAAQSGAVVTFDGAGTATIPDPSAATIGVVYYLIQTADAELIVTATTADNNAFVCDNVATSDLVTYGGAGHLIGGGMIVIGISATQWFVGALNGEGTLTPEAAD